MYTEKFGLAFNPFRAAATGDGVFVGPQLARAISTLKSGLKCRDSIITVSGPAGIGKTVAVMRALETNSAHQVVARVGRMRLDAEDVLTLLLVGLGMPQVPKGAVQRFAVFKQILDKRAEQNVRVVVVVEDALRLSEETLLELEGITAAEVSYSGGANIILMGQPGLDHKLKRPEFARIRQRARKGCQLVPYSKAELLGYVSHRIRNAGGDINKLFETAAIEMLFRCSEGIPRVINNVCDSALHFAADNDLPIVGADLIASIAAEEYGLEPASAEPVTVSVGVSENAGASDLFIYSPDAAGRGTYAANDIDATVTIGNEEPALPESNEESSEAALAQTVVADASEPVDISPAPDEIETADVPILDAETLAELGEIAPTEKVIAESAAAGDDADEAEIQTHVAEDDTFPGQVRFEPADTGLASGHNAPDQLATDSEAIADSAEPEVTESSVALYSDEGVTYVDASVDSNEPTLANEHGSATAATLAGINTEETIDGETPDTGSLPTLSTEFEPDEDLDEVLRAAGTPAAGPYSEDPVEDLERSLSELRALTSDGQVAAADRGLMPQQGSGEAELPDLAQPSSSTEGMPLAESASAELAIPGATSAADESLEDLPVVVEDYVPEDDSDDFSDVLGAEQAAVGHSGVQRPLPDLDALAAAVELARGRGKPVVQSNDRPDPIVTEASQQQATQPEPAADLPDQAVDDFGEIPTLTDLEFEDPLPPRPLPVEAEADATANPLMSDEDDSLANLLEDQRAEGEKLDALAASLSGQVSLDELGDAMTSGLTEGQAEEEDIDDSIELSIKALAEQHEKELAESQSMEASMQIAEPANEDNAEDDSVLAATIPPTKAPDPVSVDSIEDQLKTGMTQALKVLHEHGSAEEKSQEDGFFSKLKKTFSS